MSCLLVSGLTIACLMVGQVGPPGLHAQQGVPFQRLGLVGHQIRPSFSPDGKMLAASVVHGGEGEVMVWEVPSLREVTELLGHTRQPLASAFSPDGGAFVSTDVIGTIRMWRVAMAGWRRMDQIEPAVSPGTPESVSKKPKRAPACFPVFSPDGGLLAWDWDGRVRVWNLDAGEEAAVLPAEGPVHFIGFTPDGKLLEAFALRRIGRKFVYELRHWSTSTFEREGKSQRFEIGHDPTTSQAVFSADGNLVAAHMQRGEVVKLVDAQTGRFVLYPGFPAPPPQVVLNSRESWGPNAISSMCVSPDKRILAIGMNHSGNVFLCDVATGKPLSRLTHPSADHANPSVFSPDGRYLVTSCAQLPGEEDGKEDWQYVGFLWDLGGVTGYDQEGLRPTSF